MTQASAPHIRTSFDGLVERLGVSLTTLLEDDLLRVSHWELGQDARLREDRRFRLSPWRRWMRAEDLLANDALYREFHAQRRGSADLLSMLETLTGLFGQRCVFCPGDDRFVLDGERVRLAASELSKQPIIEDEVGDLEKFTTHLPIHSLKAAAASEPAGEWGPDAQEQMIETRGWIQVSIQKRLNSRMFVAQVEGHSMDDGRSGLVDGGYAVFELWPPGTKQLLNVLVRGSLRDPETGNYAVKKYVADERDEEGRHHRITLVSLNPDKESYPNIELEVEDEDALTVVAKVIQPLALGDYARRPKPIRRKGRRDLDSDEAVESIHARLAESAERFFEQDLPSPDQNNPEPDTTTWNSRLVCLDASAGGLHLEVGPLNGLWTFVKKLNVKRQDGGESPRILASNARLRPVLVSVPPASGPWDWEAVGFEDDEDVDLSALHTEGLTTNRAWAFRVDAGGVGRQAISMSLSPGQHYRILCPRSIWSDTANSLQAASVADGWQLIECALSHTVASEVREALEAIGFSIGEPQPKLRWTVTSPDAWQVNAQGEPFACFEPHSSVVLAVTGYGGSADGDARIFVHGPSGAAPLKLPAGDAALIELHDLEPGRYFCSVLHAHTRIQPAHLPFAIEAGCVSSPSATWTVTWDDVEQGGSPGEVVVPAREDLSDVNGYGLPLKLSGPRGWPVRALWKEIGSEHLKQLFLDDDGELPLPDLLRMTSERRRRSRNGDLILDLGELGRVVLEHERRPDLISARAGLAQHVSSSMCTAVEQDAGAFVRWFPLWHQPMCALLGYEAEWVGVEQGAATLPVHAALARLLVTERNLNGITRRCTRLLVMLDSLDSEPPPDVLKWIDSQCRRHDDVRSAILTTGTKWAEHRLNQRLAHKIWDLPEILEDDEQLVGFLRDVAEGM